MRHDEIHVGRTYACADGYTRHVVRQERDVLGLPVLVVTLRKGARLVSSGVRMLPEALAAKATADITEEVRHGR